MKVLANWPSKLLIHLGVLEFLVTLLTCYTLAVSYGHVPAWLPMISDCAVYAPEKYVFRLGVVIGAALIALQAVTTYNANKPSLPLAKPMAVLGVVAAAGLGVVGVVNEVEDITVHVGAAAIFFGGYDVYAVLTVYISWFKLRKEVPMVSFIIKVIAAIVGNLSFIGYLHLTFFTTPSNDFAVFAAILEWLNTFAILIFLDSAVFDELKDISLAEIEEDSTPDTKEPCKVLLTADTELKPAIPA